MKIPETGGLILCGGHSRRMGSDKASLRFPGGSLLERMVTRMLRVASPVVVSLAHGQTPPPLPDGAICVNDGEENRGPLWGLLEGFRALEGQCEQMMVLPVDMPAMTEAWMIRLAQGKGQGHDACLFQYEGITNALTAVYDMNLKTKAEGLVTDGRMRPFFLTEGIHANILDIPPHSGPGYPPLGDIDRPEDYRRALLAEGVGDPKGMPLEIDLSPLASLALKPGFMLPLQVRTPAQILEALALLYPEVTTPNLTRSNFPLQLTDKLIAGDIISLEI